MSGVTDDREARALLSRIADRATGVSERCCVGSRRSTLSRYPAGSTGLEASERYRVRLGSARPTADLERVASVGGRLLVPGDLEWPQQLADLGDASPWALWVRGTVDLRLTALRSVAVVGARAATTYGERVASQLASDLALSGWSVISGGAFGIDKAAHLGTLAARGITVAVLACGVDVSYPPSHDSLFARIAADGCWSRRCRRAPRRTVAGSSSGTA